MKRSDHEDLFKRYQSGEVTPEEQAIVEDYILNNDLNPLYLSEAELEEMTARLGDRVSKIPFGERPAVPLYRRWKVAVAAAAVAAIVAGVWFFNASRHVDTPSSRTAGRDLINDVAPGKNGATITLANGKVIELSDAKLGVVVGDALKYSDGSDVRYSSGTSSSGSLKGSQNSSGPVGAHSLTPAELQGADGKAQLLTASTARGQTYQFTLPDGTKVWLNADSKLEFPSNFVNSKTRNVKLSGEGYFEVAKDKAHPFVVSTSDQNVEVLGTHFNLNTFGDEHPGTVTSLLEGAVKVTNEVEGRILKPGDRGVGTVKGIMLLLGDADDDVDWKNGDFVFNQKSLSEIMQKVSRWYNVEVIYNGDVDRYQTFSGSVSRNKPVSAILGIIQLTKQVKFKIEGKKVYVGK